MIRSRQTFEGSAGRRSFAGLAGIALVCLTAACSTDTAPGLLAGPGVSQSPAGAAYPTAATGTAPAFNPFSPDDAVSTPTRLVIAKPTQSEILEPGPLPEFSLGRADAPVVMVKYMSLTCQYCRRFMADSFPELKRAYIDTGKVRLIIREFPIGRSSGNATIALRCAPMDKYLTLYQKFLQQQATWVSQEVRPDAIFKIADQVGMTRPQFDACLKNQSMIAGLQKVKERGRQLGVIGTPNFFIGDRLVKTVVGMKEIRAIVDPMLAAGAGGAGAQGTAVPG